MKRSPTILCIACLAAMPLASGWATDRPTPSLKTPASTAAAAARRQMLALIDQWQAEPTAKSHAKTAWATLPNEPSEDELLARTARTFAALDPNAATLLEQCAAPSHHSQPPSPPWLADRKLPTPFTANMRLLLGRWLIHQALFEEAREQLDGLRPNDVVAPATLLFYQSAAYHAMLDKEPGLKTLDDLLHRADASPQRYVALAKLMQEDLQGLKEDTLDHVARRMDDVRRRLDLGRAGPKVRNVEDGVIESLDKMIKKLEEQQKQQQCESGSESIRSNQPAADSTPIGGKGRGEVVKKNIGSGDGWGNLPPKEREEALQQIGRDFPSHYRDTIEQYFRRLAAGAEK